MFSYKLQSFNVTTPLEMYIAPPYKEMHHAEATRPEVGITVTVCWSGSSRMEAYILQQQSDATSRGDTPTTQQKHRSAHGEA